MLTNDGGLARTLELPATGWLRRYRVRAHGRVRQEELDRLHNGITIAGIRYGSIEARLEREQGANSWLTFAMREGKNREVKNVLGHLGLAVNRLIRVSFGPFQLGDLPEGAVEEVKTRILREQLGDRIAALSGRRFFGADPQRAPGRRRGSRRAPAERASRERRQPRRAPPGRPPDLPPNRARARPARERQRRRRPSASPTGTRSAAATPSGSASRSWRAATSAGAARPVPGKRRGR